MAPAAASLLHPARYAAGVLSGTARLPVPPVPFDYVSAGELASVAAGALVAALRGLGLPADPGAAPVRVLRAAHTGSANDYAAYAVAGLLVVIAALSLT